MYTKYVLYNFNEDINVNIWLQYTSFHVHEMYTCTLQSLYHTSNDEHSTLRTGLQTGNSDVHITLYLYIYIEDWIVQYIFMSIY